ncbi:hypothetical protein ACP70R_010469 [Stipagrostis hirtigluma subsp. patula]
MGLVSCHHPCQKSHRAATLELGEESATSRRHGSQPREEVQEEEPPLSALAPGEEEQALSGLARSSLHSIDVDPRLVYGDDKLLLEVADEEAGASGDPHLADGKLLPEVAEEEAEAGGDPHRVGGKLLPEVAEQEAGADGDPHRVDDKPRRQPAEGV